MLAIFDKELENFQSLILPTSESKPRTPFDSPDLPTEKMSMANMSSKQLMSTLPIMLPLVANMRISSKMYDGKFQPKKSEVTQGFIRKLEEIAKASGAKDIKYVKVPRKSIFQDKGIPNEFAIVFTHRAIRYAKARIRAVGAAGPLPHIAENLAHAVRLLGGHRL
jgi:hypothetical protein